MIPLRQSTAVTVTIGPFVDATDAVTAETGLTISQADVRLAKDGGSFAQKNESSAATHLENGYYSVALNATDTNTVGALVVAVNESGACPLRQTFQVYEEAVYDRMCASSAAGPATGVEVRSAVRSSGAGLVAPIVAGKTGVYDILGEWPIAGRASCVPLIDSWCDAIDAFCGLTRSAVYYFSATGSDGADGLTESTPKQTIGAMNTLLAAGATVLLKRGDTWRSTTPIAVGGGALGAYGTGPKPRVTGCTITIAASAAWTLATGNRYTITQADCGYIRPQSWPVTAIFRRAASTAECEANSNTFHVDGSTLSVNFGGTNPNTVAWEGVTQTAAASDSVHGATVGSGGRVEGVQFDHQGFSPGTTNQSWGVQATLTGEQAAVVSDCGLWMQSTHNDGSTGLTAGGRFLVQRCDMGGGLSQNFTAYVAYNFAGGQHAVVRDCTFPVGRVPTGLTLAGSTVGNDGSSAVYVHTNGGGAQVGFFASLRNRCPAGHAYPTTRYGFASDCPGTRSDLASHRAIHALIETERVTGGRSLVGYDLNAFVSCRFENRPVYDGAVFATTNDALRGWALACEIDFDWSLLTTPLGFLYGWSNSAAANLVSPRFVNCHIRQRGNTSSGLVQVNADISGATVVTLEGASINTVWDADNANLYDVTIGNVGSVAAGGVFVNNAIRNMLVSTSNERGYSAWTATQVLQADPIVGAPAPSLLGLGSTVHGALCEVDRLGRPLARPGETIGPWGEVLEAPVTSRLALTPTQASKVAGAFQAADYTAPIDSAATQAAAAAALTAYDAATAADVAASGGTVTAEDISPKRTWTFPGTGSTIRASNTIEVAASQAGPFTVCFDLDGILEDNVVLASITSTAITGTAATLGTAVQHTSKRKVNIPLSSVTATAGTYTLTLTFVATDSEQYVVKGTLEVV